MGQGSMPRTPGQGWGRATTMRGKDEDPILRARPAPPRPIAIPNRCNLICFSLIILVYYSLFLVLPNKAGLFLVGKIFS